MSKQRDNSADNDTSGSEVPVMKRKRNSYADSPHKLRCPYCPRAFPWISSLKRHILTHTGVYIGSFHSVFLLLLIPAHSSTRYNSTL